MASETGSSNQSPSTETNSINIEIPLFLPFILGLSAAVPLQDSENPPPQATQDHAATGQSRDRVVLINPFAHSMVVVESAPNLDSFLGDLSSGKSDQRPVSKASIEAMPSVEIVNDQEQCAVCLEGYESGERAKEMPCKHRFHGECMEKWLKIRGSCPVCRFEMPVDEDDDVDRKARGERNDGERRGGIWVNFIFGGNWRSGDSSNLTNNSSNDSSDSLSDHQETVT